MFNNVIIFIGENKYLIEEEFKKITPSIYYVVDEFDRTIRFDTLNIPDFEKIIELSNRFNCNFFLSFDEQDCLLIGELEKVNETIKIKTLIHTEVPNFDTIELIELYELLDEKEFYDYTNKWTESQH